MSAVFADNSFSLSTETTNKPMAVTYNSREKTVFRRIRPIYLTYLQGICSSSKIQSLLLYTVPNWSRSSRRHT